MGYEDFFVKPFDILKNPKAKQQYENNIKRFIHKSGDHITLLKIFYDFYMNPDKYKYTSDGISSIYGSRVDFAFYDPTKIEGDETLLNYYESDHKPLLFDFDIKPGKVSGGGSFNFIILIAIIVVFLVIIIYLFIDYRWEKNYNHNKIVNEQYWFVK